MNDEPRGCICQDQQRRGYCAEPGCPYAEVVRDQASRIAKEANPALQRRPIVTIFVPEGYADAAEFLKDCQFERVESDTQFAADAKAI
jgi:hypothetical protein